ncbi:MAG: IS4 family transposase [Parachlamydiaceae bacterium]|nr:IS4 family transposase [Parachlamydiaceae bacterium]
MSKSLTTNRKIRKSIKEARKISRSKKKKAYCSNPFGSAQAREVARIKKSASNKKKNEENEIKKAKQYANKILAPFDEATLNIMANASRFLKRKSKLLPVYFIAAIVFTYLSNGENSMLLITSNLEGWFSISISTQAISQRMRNKSTAKFLKDLFIFQLNQKLQPCVATGYSKYLTAFKSIKIADSTHIELSKHTAKGFKGCHGNASKSSLKLNFLIDIFNLKTTSLDLKSGNCSDKTFSKNINRWLKFGELLIRDLGYFSLDAFKSIEALGAFYLSRLQKGVNIYINKQDEAPIDIESFFKKEIRKSHNKIVDFTVYLGTQKLASRLIVFKTPKWVIKQRLKKYKISHKKIPGEDYVIWSGYSFFVTNIEKTMCTSEAIFELYTIRWQIELIFKSYKSTFKLDVIRGTNKSCVECILYAKLIGILISERLASFAAVECEAIGRELSFDKTMKWLKNENKIIVAILGGELAELILDLAKKLKYLWKDKRKKEPSTCKKVLKVLQDPNESSYYKPVKRKVA